MRRLLLLVPALVLACAAGCGSDGGGGTDSGPGTDAGGDGDGGSGGYCDDIEGAPDPEGLMEPCCYRASNAERLASPEFRVSGVSLESPGSLGNMIIAEALKLSLDEERFNWLLLIEGADSDGTVDITTGYGIRNDDSTYRFADGDAPSEGGNPDRWDPVMETATLDGETLTSDPASQTVVLPIFDEDGVTLQTELPLRSLVLEMATMSVDRSCIGVRERSGYDTSQGRIRTFVTVEDAKARRITIPPIDRSLCRLIADTGGETCDAAPRSDWSFPPDALCEGGSCEADPGDGSVCDPMADCNAWLVVGGFSAHGVEIQ